MKRQVFSILAFSVLTLTAAPALAQGYTGLIPENNSTSTPEAAAPAIGDGGYNGLIAPSPTPAPTGKNAPVGYNGVVAGKVDAPAAAVDADPNAPKVSTAPAAGKAAAAAPKQVGGFTPINQQPKVSYPKGLQPKSREFTLQDLKTLSAISKQGVDFNHMTPELAKSLKLPEDTADVLNKIQRPRIDGMLPAEFAAKRTIDSLMDNVSKTKGDDARRKLAQSAFTRLSGMADGYRTLGSVPDGIYQRMGVSDTYVKEEREGYTKALDRLHEAMEALQPLTK